MLGRFNLGERKKKNKHIITSPLWLYKHLNIDCVGGWMCGQPNISFQTQQGSNFSYLSLQVLK